MTFNFEILKTHGNARTGRLTTPHGTVHTPAMTIVATRATVKAVTARELLDMGVQLVIANTYHLMLRPGAETIEALGGLHQMMAWPHTILTDSGGFQVFSLGSSIRDGVGKIGSIFPDEQPGQPLARQGESLVQIDEDGVAFRSHIDGSPQHLSPESSIRIQTQLGADIIVAFDECTSPLDDHDYTKEAMERTHRWARRSLDAFEAHGSGAQRLYGIVQGGAYRNLRITSAQVIGEMPFWGYCIGGSLGKSKTDMFDILDWTLPLLPDQKPRHLLGIGEIEDIFQSVARGIDTFDCIIPTRWARNGWLMLSPEAARAEYPNAPHAKHHLNILNAKHTADRAPIDSTCTCFTCQNHSRGYLRHLFKSKELLAYTLATLHNVHYYIQLMVDIRAAIAEGRLASLYQSYTGRALSS